eukprot:m.346211 g.346211  ORF g.346211 m.346211 type:complete len:771 (+) comp28414_c0_seq1:76-2388(+)
MAVLFWIMLCVFSGTAAQDTGLSNFNASGDFTVIPTTVAKNPGAFSASSAYNFNSFLHAGGFEPMIQRRKYIVREAARDTVITDDNAIGVYDTYVDGYLDNATIRVYRIFNGKFKLVRNDTVKRTRSSGWSDAASGLVPINTTTARLVMPNWFRPNATMYYGVRAVDMNGNTSDASYGMLSNTPLPVSSTPNQNALNHFIPPVSQKSPNNTVPPVPNDVKVSADMSTGIITLTWSAVSWSTLAGYELVQSYKNPEQLLGYGLDLTDTGSGQPGLLPGDIVFLERKTYTFSREGVLAPRVWNTLQVGKNPSLLTITLCQQVGCDGRRDGTFVFNGEVTGASWELVKHPEPVPLELMKVAGETCAHISVSSSAKAVYASVASGGIFASTNQSYYPTPLPSRKYKLSIWMRSSTPVTVMADFSMKDLIAPVNFSVTPTWTKFEYTFSPAYTYNISGSVISLTFTWPVPAEMYLDNWRIYDMAADLLDAIPEDRQALQESGLGFLRTHWLIKSSWGYTMNSLTNPAGVTEYQANGDPHTLHTLASVLRIMANASINPWLQIEQYFDEAELLGLVEYLAAPYDPSKDTPQQKPYAYKRFMQNQTQPYTDVFDKFIYEVSNENWNPMFCPWCWSFGWNGVDNATNTTVSNSQMYGLWQEYTISVLKSSPYWTSSVDSKFTFSLGGWAASDDKYTGFGPQAALVSPNSSYSTVAGYNGGWDEGETPAVPDNEGFFKALSFTEQDATVHALNEYMTLQNLSKTQHAHYNLGTYEAGPG